MSEKPQKQYKENPADVEAGKWLDDQKELAPKRRGADLALLISMCLIIAVFGILIFALPSEDFSYDENRVLADFPSFNIESLMSGEFTSGIGEFYADRFPARNVFVGVKALAEKLLLKGENNGVIEGDDGYLVERLEYTDAEYENIRASMNAIERFVKANPDCDVSVALLPRAVDVMTSKLPRLYSTERAKMAFEVAKDAYPNVIDLTEMLKSRADAGEYVWYKTDHHYTTLGAYYTYVELGKTLGYEPYPLDHFTKEVISTEFLGTTYSSSGMKWASGDDFTLFRFEGDENYTVSYPNSTVESFSGFYREEFFTQKDRYSAFLGGNRGRTSISLNGGEGRPTLMIFKDSFSHSLVPFLSLHFDIELVDLRYYQSSSAKLLSEIAPDKVLILYGIDTLAVSNDAAKIAMGIK